jgi:hypothetical protein
MRQVALTVTRNGVDLLKRLDQSQLRQAVAKAGWELVSKPDVFDDLQSWGWQALDAAREPRAEIAVLGSVDEVNPRHPNDLSLVYRTPADLPWFWASPHHMDNRPNDLTLSWLPSFPEEPFDHGWFDQSYDTRELYRFAELWLRAVSARLRLKVFISYAREDAQAARQLCDRLVAAGHEPWLDQVSLLPGQDWQLEIRRAVRAADAVITLISKRSAAKVGYVQKELRLAVDAAERRPEGRIFVIPVLLDDAAVPDSLSQWNHLDATRSDWFEVLVRTLDHIRTTS